MWFLVVLLFFVTPVQAKEFKVIVPDTYSCSNDGCNSCTFTVRKILPNLNQGCTELGCILQTTAKTKKLYKQCSKDWRYSKFIRYVEFTNAENLCVNGVRTNNYWEANYKRKNYGKNHAFSKCLKHYSRPFEKKYSKRTSDICQDEWIKFVLTDSEIMLKHAEQSAGYAYKICNRYFENDLKKYGFSESEHMVLARYIATRKVSSIGTTIVSGKEVKNIDVLKKIFNILRKDGFVNHSMVVTSQMVDEFMVKYNSSN
jgi:hypothetical protein